MSLSPDEQVRLDRIEAHIGLTDPVLCDRLARLTPAVHRRRQVITAVVFAVLGSALVAVGGALAGADAGIGGLAVVVGAGAVARAVLVARRLNPPFPW